MATEKRKAAVSDKPAKRLKFDDDGKARAVATKPDKAAEPSKYKPNLAAAGKEDRKPREKSNKDFSKDAETQRRPLKSSVLSPEDRAFPRGGASVLTPLEKRQIQADAERDVLFEEAGKPKASRDDYGEDEATNVSGEKEAASTKRRKSKKPAKPLTKEDQDQVKILGLSYKSLATGSLVLGQVSAITSRDVALALPNNLTGFIPITAISDAVDHRIQALLDEDAADTAADDRSEDMDDVDLSKLFRIGQYLRAYVTSTVEPGKGASSKRHISLSINPRQANEGLTAGNIEENSMIQVAVKSVEDHGMVVDLGLDDDSVRGFISKKELGQQWKIEDVQPGQVMLGCITGFASDKKVVKITPDHLRVGDTKHVLRKAATIDPFMPGAAAEMLVTSITGAGLAGKIIGSIDATADPIQSGFGTHPEAFNKLKVGSKVAARILFTFPNTESKKVGVSLLDHVRKFEEAPKALKKRRYQDSDIIESVKVTKVVPGIGVFFDVAYTGQYGYAHISKLADSKVEVLFEETGPFAVGSTHRARVLNYNAVDGVYNLSLQESILSRKYLRLEDVEMGSVVEGTIQKIMIAAEGVNGLLLDIGDGIIGLVPRMHMADVQLSHPERRFREGIKVKARVLSVNIDKRQMRLTLKKTLINTDTKIWKQYDGLKTGDESAGTIISIKPNGAVIQFYGTVRAWLPVAEMSEAYISDATQHFRLGQTVIVHVRELEGDDMIVSCRSETAIDTEQSSSFDAIQLGQLVDAKVTEVSKDLITMEEIKTKLRAFLQISQLTDGSEEKSTKLAQQLRIGQSLTELVVLDKRRNQQSLVLSNKPSLITEAKAKKLITKLGDVIVGNEVHGFVRNITPDGIFVEFAGETVAFLPKSHIPQDKHAVPAFGYRKGMSIVARVLSLDASQQRFALSMRRDAPTAPEKTKSKTVVAASDVELRNAVDGASTSLQDFSFGKETEARITSVKDTQLNVQLADNVYGRVDVSEVFDDWSDINDRKRPLSKFRSKQVIKVKVLGIHDARNHRFLPITHRSSKDPVFELTAKTASALRSEDDLLTLEKLEVESSWIAFVNNVADSCLWVNITPNVRGRVDYMSLTDDAGLLQDVPKNFPIGSALRVVVKRKDVAAGKLDLAATGIAESSPQTISDVSVGTVVPVRIVQVTERFLRVALSETVTGVIGLTEITDDYDETSTGSFVKGAIIRAAVVEVDVANKRLFLSIRPSKVLSSSLQIVDPQVTSLAQLKPTQVIRGFIKLVRNNGVVVSLGPRVEAFVRVADLSDAYIKDWQSEFQIDQLVKGKLLAVDPALNHVQMSLKASHVDKYYVPPRKLEDLEEGEIVTGKIRKVEDFGVFIDVDDTLPRVSGLCHRSQIADKKIGDVKSLYDAGDIVKAKILSIDLAKRKISFGLKASYFTTAEADSEDDDMIDADAGVALAGDEDEMSIDGGIDLSAVREIDDDIEDDDESADNSELDMDLDQEASSATAGLQTSGFDWTGALLPTTSPFSSGAPLANSSATKAPKPARASTTFTSNDDRTGELDASGPQSVADYERLLLATPHDSSLWVSYMAFHLRLSEVSTARALGYRALETIPLRETDEKMQVWIALLNLEVAYSSPSDNTTDGRESGTSAVGGGEGSPSAVERVFRQACAVQDPYAVHLCLARIYTAADDLARADALYASMLASSALSSSPSSLVPNVATDKTRRAFRATPALWLAYASFLFTHLPAQVERARALLPRALQSVPPREARGLTVEFAKLEFRHASDEAGGEPERARTVLEGVVGQWPRWSQGWDAWVEGETGLLARMMLTGNKDGEVDADRAKGKKGKKAAGNEDEVKVQKARVEGLYERLVKGPLKTRRAKSLFKRWKEFEEKYGDEKDVQRVVALAREWVERARDKADQGDGADEDGE